MGGYFFGSGGAGDQIILTYNGFFMLHEMLKGHGISKFREPFFALGIFFPSVCPIPLGQQRDPFRVNFGYGGKMIIEKCGKPGKIIHAQFRKKGVIQIFDPQINFLLPLHPIGFPQVKLL